ncbi:hypothetical protein [Novosphingobium kaempferiae]|uniref:hypothetical protein n=1 Tax=Novosphingobium kaempferiae TaxID=2896849 RepID=UPI001E5DD7DE|nr:hypothetical protein [Novosphingobium kaempferiae]
MKPPTTPRRKPPAWFKWTVLGGMLLAVAVPTACVMNHGQLPGYDALPAFAH